jgi:hypothetical protein
MEFSFNEFEPLQFVRVWFGSGDGTVPLLSATQGASEGRAPLGDNVPIHYVCGVDHVKLPGNASVQSSIEGFLIKGEALGGTSENCPYTGVETEFYVLPIPNHGAFASAAASPATATVVTPSGTLSLEQAFEQGIVQVIHNGYKWIVLTDDHHPATLQLSGKGMVIRTRSLTSAGKGLAKGSGPAHHYEPVNGTVTIDPAGAVKRNGRPLKTVRAPRAPRTTAHVTRRGRWFIVRLTTARSTGVVTYVKFGKGAARRYRRPLRLTKAKLKALRFASVDRLGDWEHPRRVGAPPR